MAGFSLFNGIKALQMHGSDDHISNPLLILIFSIYSLLRPYYPSLFEILKQVPDASEENLLNFDNRIITMVRNKENVIDKNKRDLMRKILKPVIALQVGEKYKRTVHFRHFD